MQIQEHFLSTILFEHFGKLPYILFSVAFITANIFSHFREYINAKLGNGNVSDSTSLDL